jgi:hypothetical protein
MTVAKLPLPARWSPINVANTAPTVVLSEERTPTIGVPFTIKVGADDPSSADMASTFHYTVDWGDGSPVESADGPSDPPFTHTYTQLGSFAPTFTVTDEDGGGGTQSDVPLQVVPAPTTTTTTTTPTTTSPTTTAAPATTTTVRPNGQLPPTGGRPGNTMTIVVVLLMAGVVMITIARRPTRASGK